jgi:hypothetical protein
MRYVNLDKFLEDLRNERCDVFDFNEYGDIYESGYSYELIEQVAERQDVIVKE